MHFDISVILSEYTLTKSKTNGVECKLSMSDINRMILGNTKTKYTC